MNLKEWFNSDLDYTTGVAIYAALPDCNKVILKSLTASNSKQNLFKLKYELKKRLIQKKNLSIVKKSISKPSLVVKAPPKVSTNKPPELFKKATAVKKDPIYMADLPRELRPILAEAHALFIENCRLKIELNETPAKVNTYDLQKKIEDNFIRNSFCWNQITFFKTHGYLPPAPEAEFSKLTPAQLVKRQALKWAQISKAKKYIAINENRLKTESFSLKEKVRIENRIEAKKSQLLTFESEILKLNTLINE